jgi:hypothetical protein
MMDLIDSASSKVSFEASRFVLAVNKIAPPREGGAVNLNFSGENVGYVIRLENSTDEILEGEIGIAGGVVTGRAMTDAERLHGITEQRHPMIDVSPRKEVAE